MRILFLSTLFSECTVRVYSFIKFFAKLCLIVKIVRKSAAREGRTPPWPENGRPSVLEFGPSLGKFRI